MKPIYLDYNATTPVDPRVLDEMLPYLKSEYGNPSSDHYYGREGKKALSKARERVSQLLNCEPDEIVFTSCGSESNNLAIKGAAYSCRERGNHLITSRIEHPAVLEVFSYLGKNGYSSDYIDVDEYACIKLESLKDLIRPQTVLISIMHSNNEVGTIQPVKEAAFLAKEKNILFHSDAAQSVGKVHVDFKDLGADLLSVAGHKFYAPKGVGALVIKRGVKISSIMHGAGHERGMRAGTENVPYIVALGMACELARKNMEQYTENMLVMRELLFEGLNSEIEGLKVNGHIEKRLPNTLSLSFPGINANTLLSEITDIATSPGAACHSESGEISHVLKAMGVAGQRGFSTIRFSVGRETDRQEIERAVSLIAGGVRRLGGRIEMKENTEGEEYKLTKFTHGLGCACKISPGVLEGILKKFSPPDDERILVGLDTKDDAAVYLIDEERAIVQTVDFFTPIVDDPFTFGEIALANALSDIYAMGAKPMFALNIAAFPSKRLPITVLEKILQGAHSKAEEAKISIIGGHTIEDDEPKYGLCVTGMIHPKRIFTNANAKPGDVLILTKPIGTGIITTAIKQGIAKEEDIQNVTKVMCELNDKASEVMVESSANACTDITGFGLLGHALEMAKASGVEFEINFKDVPLIKGLEQIALMGNFPGGTRANLEFVNRDMIWGDSIDDVSKLILADAQTSGGLLISIPESESDGLLKKLSRAGVDAARIIGKVLQKGEVKISIRS